MDFDFNMNNSENKSLLINQIPLRLIITKIYNRPIQHHIRFKNNNKMGNFNS
jgi:hypothetical protein